MIVHTCGCVFGYWCRSPLSYSFWCLDSLRSMKAALYLRISTNDKGQNVQVQEGPLSEWVVRLGYEPVVYSEEGISGAKTTRPVLERLRTVVRRREVSAVAVWKLDRLGRSLSHLLQLLEEMEAHGIRLLVHDMAMDTATPQGRLFFSIMGAFAEFERALTAERVRDGLGFAQSHGTRSGRPIGRPRTERDFWTIYDTLIGRAGEPGLVSKVAREFGVPRAWLYREVIPELKKVGGWSKGGG